MKNKILVLGSGFVSRPGVTYLLDQKHLQVTVASLELSEAEKLVKGYDNGVACYVDVQDEAALEKLIQENDIVISLLPWIFHIKVAKLCLKHNKDMATTSYVSEEMRQLDEEVKAKGLLFLNEMGVDPGIDHMSAKKIIDQVHEEGGKIVHFYSYCGGLPAPDDNDNPFGYKFSWSPRGVVLASRNSARFLENGEVKEIVGKDLFRCVRSEEVDGVGQLEVYPNRDSVVYKDIYGIQEAETVMRGTYRYCGWCETFKKLVDLGLVDDTAKEGLNGITFKQMMAKIAGVENGGDVKAAIAEKVGLAPDAAAIGRMEWLGLFSDDIVPDENNYLDILSRRLQEKLYYKDGEKDMIVLQHKFTVENKDKTRYQITSTLIDYGVPHGDTSMARTVSFPLAIGVKLMAEGEISLKGVQIPREKAIYETVLEELEKLNIKMVEKRAGV